MLPSELDLSEWVNASLAKPNSSKYDLMLEKMVAILELYLERDFTALVQLLYRVDVAEKHIIALSSEEPLTATVLAKLLLDRIIEKEKNKKANTLPKQDDETSAIERW